MADSGDGDERTPYSAYAVSIYQNGIMAGQLPIVTTDPNGLQAQAKKAMGPESFNYVFGGAGELSTMDANRLAFRQWKIVPRFLRPSNPRDLKTELFGVTYESPLLMAPIGVQSIFHEDKETGLAAACAELQVPYTLSTAATSTIEEVAKVCGDQHRWFQLYWPMDDDITGSILRRARANGYKVLVVTLDTVTLAWRPADLDQAYLPFITGTGNSVGFSDPVFRKKFSEQNDGDQVEDNIISASRYWISQAFPGDHHSWKDLALLKKNWDGPIVLKGVLSVEDAKLAVEHGMSGIIVSNHGGRQLDGGVASLEVLPEIVEAVGDKLTVMFDSGIRTGADIVKAIALGAKAVFVGRPAIYGLGIAGKEGAKAVIAGLLADLDLTMGLSGFKSLSELKPSILRQVRYGGDMKANL
ncbi:FMN-dependent dehydrogenase [Colletotrichum scovillei]|uniref:FMN-dependent dehydrogenase n=1 Tax=Colletotrichum scovillei TaxID=1209932 RepID=A0A9P7UFE8_9PEZI|nr:FMN-dependent dehydrogenase [Colletotrichum scovillei]KAF4781712.1 FMN-dependent dehydrogenase [Colletotrichum scovillei]KAG7050612.1 FMN-dependent dehydrogenase [Colletotrichum scovillei]KAG7069656.1 FMN-dependent dehydrogenase [Colletotrichum scovillei]KAG7073530.1 FMN-dependent dehydrogenase [Colletotrichum scovillei]